MSLKKLLLPPCLFFACFISSPIMSQNTFITNDAQNKNVVFGNDKIKMNLDYNGKANISSVIMNGQQVVDGSEGIYSSLKTKEANYSSMKLLSQPLIKIINNTITVSNIIYGDKAYPVNETWKFIITSNNVQFTITRNVSKSFTAEKAGLPVFIFKDTSVWDGAYTDYGGLAWFYLFNKKLDTYGVHTSTSEFWNSKTGNGLTVAVTSPGNHIAMDYSRTEKDQLACTIAVAQNELTYRFDSGTNRRRYVRDTTDVWAPVAIKAGTTTTTITLAWFDYKQASDRGNMVGINGDEVKAVLNTIARIGVIDKQHFGGNSWHTPYGPICLHEQYIAQLGLGINDSNYLKGYQDCLDFYRDSAIRADGRVWARWAYTNEDAMPGKFTGKGFYEAQWGYLLDANPDFVTNVAELYNMNGNLAWIKTQQHACEKALDWILKRDSNHNGLVEMMTDSHTQNRGSDWIDIIWASYENAFVNAKLYHALVLWADVEKQLGDVTKENYYRRFATKLKTSFNKSTSEGGFWDDEKKCYIHWRDKDGSVHGNNMVTPVNFMAIAYGICDDSMRAKTILDDIETQMEKEHLFFWPLCMYSYEKSEGNDWQFPFPNYENGDIFLSWGSVAVKAYASYKPELALKYVKNVLAQYSKDGLAFQRYGRTKQDGLGDDILSGNSLSVVGLYQAIYGINPRYNRFYLDPHITKELAGTQIKYNYRNKQLLIDLVINNYAIADDRFKIISKTNFGFYGNGNQLSYFNGSNDTASLELKTTTKQKLTIDIQTWTADQMSWTQAVDNIYPAQIAYKLNSLLAKTIYSISVNGNEIQKLQSSESGSLKFDLKTADNLKLNIVTVRKL
jgi:hypothetical protein